MAETLRASLSTGQPLGAALKRYEGAGYGRMFEREDGEYVRYSDYTAMERKCQELERERDELREWNAQLDTAVKKLSLERDDAQAELSRLRAVEAAAQEYKKSMADAIEEDRPEWTRLRDIEVAARDMLAKLDSEGYSGPYMRALAEACGRKG